MNESTPEKDQMLDQQCQHASNSRTNNPRPDRCTPHFSLPAFFIGLILPPFLRVEGLGCFLVGCALCALGFLLGKQLYERPSSI